MVGNVLKGLFWLGPHFWKIFKGREGFLHFPPLPCPSGTHPLPPHSRKPRGRDVLVARPSSLQKPAPHSEVTAQHV